MAVAPDDKNFELKVELEDLLEFCRVCMIKKINMKDVFCIESNRTVEELQFCTGILVTKEDGLPTTICEQCLTKLAVAYEFKNVCLRSDVILRRIQDGKIHLNGDIKKEVISKEFDYDIAVTKQEIEDGDIDPGDNLNNEDEIYTLQPIKPNNLSTKKSSRRQTNFLKTSLKITKRTRKIPLRKPGQKIPVPKPDNKIPVQKPDKKIARHKPEERIPSLNQDLQSQEDQTLPLNEYQILPSKEDQILPSKEDQNLPSIDDENVPLKDDRKKVKNSTLRLFCEPCGLKCSNKEAFMKHRQLVHGCSFICEICGKQFMHRSSHHSHMRSHLPPQYKCERCDYNTWHSADMKKHVRIHTGEKRYVCEYCTSAFYNISNLYGHIRRKHDGKKTYKCPRCDLSFFSTDKLRRHLDSHDNIKRFECEVCHAQFTRRCHWKKHLLKQHSVAVPRLRPGRRKVNIVKDYIEKDTILKDS